MLETGAGASNRSSASPRPTAKGTEYTRQMFFEMPPRSHVRVTAFTAALCDQCPHAVRGGGAGAGRSGFSDALSVYGVTSRVHGSALQTLASRTGAQPRRRRQACSRRRHARHHARIVLVKRPRRPADNNNRISGRSVTTTRARLQPVDTKRGLVR